MRIVIPTWKSEEVLDLALLTVFLVLRTFLSIYIAAVNGKIVKAIIERDFGMFVRRVTFISNSDHQPGTHRPACLLRQLLPRVRQQEARPQFQETPH